MENHRLSTKVAEVALLQSNREKDQEKLGWRKYRTQLASTKDLIKGKWNSQLSEWKLGTTHQKMFCGVCAHS